MTATEIFMSGDTATSGEIENVCRYATDGHDLSTVAVATPSAFVGQAARLLVGTGIGTVSMLDASLPLGLQARKSTAAGAAEVCVPATRLSEVAAITSALGAHTPVTIDVTTGLDLDPHTVQRALATGVDFISFHPDLSRPQGLVDVAQLLEITSTKGDVAVKIAAHECYHQQLEELLLHADDYLATHSRVCLSAQCMGA